jgi:hypothetical protein
MSGRFPFQPPGDGRGRSQQVSQLLSIIIAARSAISNSCVDVVVSGRGKECRRHICSWWLLAALHVNELSYI